MAAFRMLATVDAADAAAVPSSAQALDALELTQYTRNRGDAWQVGGRERLVEERLEGWSRGCWHVRIRRALPSLP